MGQSYCIVNLDKKEVLNPYEFNAGSKLTELTSSCQLMTALAVLTSAGNGYGGGDVSRSAHSTDKDFEPRDGEKIAYENQAIARYNAAQGTMFRSFVPALSGHWAGDRVVTAGQYMEPGRYLTKTQQLYAGAKKLISSFHYDRQNHREQSNWSISTWLEKQATGDDCLTTLFAVAGFGYTDISEDIQHQLSLFDCTDPTRETVLYDRAIGMLSDHLIAEYPRSRIAKKGKKEVYELDLTWMTCGDLRRFICDYTPREFTVVRRWLKKQYLLPWQRLFLKYINPKKAGEYTEEQIHNLISQHEKLDPDVRLWPRDYSQRPALLAKAAQKLQQLASGEMLPDFTLLPATNTVKQQRLIDLTTERKDDASAT